MRSTAAELSQRLASNAEAVCRHYLSAGRKNGRYWLVGDAQNNPGRSLYVRLHGPQSGQGAAGKWTDASTGEHGDLLDLIALRLGLREFAEVATEARRFLNQPLPPLPAEDLPPVPSNSTPAARRLFAASKTIVGTLGQTYLRGRAITASLAFPVLRYHPSCYHRDIAGVQTQWPAIVAGVTDLAGIVTGVHRIWLGHDGHGKAPLEDPRRSMGDILGSAIRLGEVADVLAAGEGLETMMALKSLLPAMPMAAATSANHLAAIAFPSTMTRLYIAADNDVAGRIAAERFLWRAIDAQLEALLLVPVLDDWNSDLIKLGATDTLGRLRAQLHPDDVLRYFPITADFLSA